MKKIATQIFICLLLIANGSSLFAQKNFVQYVNPFIGTGGHGHTFPGATTPFGMVQLSPDTRIDGSWDGCSGYYYADSIIYGFSHTHLSGTGCSDYGDIAFIPNYVSDEIFEHNETRYEKIPLQSTYQHKNEKAEAGYYSVLLDNGIKVELTATPRVGLQRYTFTKSGYVCIVLNLKHRDELLEGSIHPRNEKEVSGIRRSKAWATNQTLFYDYEVSKKWVTNIQTDKNSMEYMFYKVKAGDEILIKTGISACDEKGALNNRTTELPGWDFEKTKKAAQDLWNKELGKIEVSDDLILNPSPKEKDLKSPKVNVGGISPSPLERAGVRSKEDDKMIIFYTALYHCMIHPSLYSDVDNRYRGRDNKIHSTEGKFDYYTVFSLWDTYRALHPLLTIIDTKRTNDFINTFLCQYQQGGRLPVWELSSNETDCMIGYHSVSVIWDAYNKGIRGYDANLAFEAMKHSAMEDRNGLKFYKEKGYISSEDDNESVSKTLEYAYDDWCIAQMAKALEKEEDYKYFIKRAYNPLNLYDVKTGFFRPRFNGGWKEPFIPSEVNNNYTEANAYQYSFAAPHLIRELTSLHYEKFTKFVDSLFSVSSKLEGRQQADISGMIGQYAHGNEPSHHMTYLYEYIHQSPKTFKLTTSICNDLYKNSPDGLCGNEDCGQMSAWYVLNSIGIYFFCPGSGEANMTQPIFKSIKINLENGKSHVVLSNINNNEIHKNVSDELIYNKAVFQRNGFLNSDTSYFTHSIYSGNEDENQSISLLGRASIIETPFVLYPKGAIPIPLISAKAKTFSNEQEITLSYGDNVAFITCDTSGKEPNISSLNHSLDSNFVVDNRFNKDYYFNSSDPNENNFIKFKINKSCTIKAKVFYDSKYYNTYDSSITVTAKFTKLPFNHSLKLISKYDNLYAAGGEDALIDLERGSENWRIGNWQGYAGKDFVGIVDVGSSKELKSIGLGCLQDQGAWVMMPPQVIFEGSNDGKTFEMISTVKTNVSDTINHALTKDVVVSLANLKGSPNFAAKPYRYYKVTAKNYGKLPSWHWSKGEPAWIFVDEILIEE